MPRGRNPEAIIVAQALAVAPERSKQIGADGNIPEKLRRQVRQSRIIAALNETTGNMRFSPAYAKASAGRPTRPDLSEMGIILDRGEVQDLCQKAGVECGLETARKRKTTISLSGMPPREPTHFLQEDGTLLKIDPNIPDYKLEMLINGGGGLMSSALLEEYRQIREKREKMAREWADLKNQKDPGPEIEF